jgi:hypothetical protein
VWVKELSQLTNCCNTMKASSKNCIMRASVSREQWQLLHATPQADKMGSLPLAHFMEYVLQSSLNCSFACQSLFPFANRKPAR